MGPLHRHLRGYDIVALQNPNFIRLRPCRLKHIFNRLKRENGKVFLSAAGTDPVYIRECLRDDSPLRYNEYRVFGHPAPLALSSSCNIGPYTTPEMLDYCRYIYDNIDGAITALYEYDVAVRRILGNDRTAYGGIPIDTATLKFCPPEPLPDKVRFFLGRHRHRLVEKGTDLLERAALIAADRRPGCVDLSIIENIPYQDYVNAMCNSDVLLDQIYSYSPATNAMIAMAHGINTVSGGEPEFYDFLNEDTNRPVFNAPTTLDGLSDLLTEIVDNRANLPARGKLCRDFVVKHNEAQLVARRNLDFWLSKF